MAVYIPEQMFCSFRSYKSTSGFDVMGLMTPDGTDKAAENRRQTATYNGDKSYTPISFANTPQYGFRFERFMYSNSGNGNILIYDPRGFYAETPMAKFQDLLKNVTMRDGEILKQCVWVRDGRMNKLVTVDSEEYKEFKRTTDGLKKKYKLKDVSLNDVVRLKDGTEGRFLGSFNIIRYSEEKNDVGDDGRYSSYSTTPIVEQSKEKYRCLLTTIKGVEQVMLYTTFNIIDITKPDDDIELLDDYEEYLNTLVNQSHQNFYYKAWKWNTVDIVGFVSKKEKNFEAKLELVPVTGQEKYMEQHSSYSTIKPCFVTRDDGTYKVSGRSWRNGDLDILPTNVVMADNKICTTQPPQRQRQLYHQQPDDTSIRYDEYPMFAVKVTWTNSTLDKTYERT